MLDGLLRRYSSCSAVLPEESLLWEVARSADCWADIDWRGDAVMFELYEGDCCICRGRCCCWEGGSCWAEEEGGRRTDDALVAVAGDELAMVGGGFVAGLFGVAAVVLEFAEYDAEDM